MKWFQNLKTMTKMMSAFSVVSAVLLGVGIIGITGLANMEATVNTIVDVHMKGVTAILEAEGSRLEAGRQTRQAILESDPDAIRIQVDKGEAALVKLQEHLEETQKTLVSAAARAKMKDLMATVPEWVHGNREAMRFALANNDAAALQSIRQNATLANKMTGLLSDLRDSKLALADKATDEATALYRRSRALLLGMAIAGLIFALGIGVYLSRMITAPLNHVVERATLAATGDLRVRVDVTSKDELGQMGEQLNIMMESFEQNMAKVAMASQAIRTASGELSAASQSISSGAQEQASSLEETAASLEEMTSAVKQNADNAQQAAQLAQGTREVAEKGGKVVSAAVQAMTEINASSRKIADIITAIDEIAFQTNLLALNAAVEAARAGEQGRGFAVVAGEVRNLAQRSATAAKEIKGLINDSVDKVESGSKLVNQSGAQLEEIVTSVKRVTDIVGEIAASSREQSTGIEQVNTAVTQMDAVTQSNASQTEELAGTADGLSGQAQGLMTLVQQFIISSGHELAAEAPAFAKPKAKVLPMRKAGVHLAHTASPASAPVASRAATGTDGFEEF